MRARPGVASAGVIENLNTACRDPQATGRFWAAALGAQESTTEPDYLEARLPIAGEAYLDLCFERVDTPPAPTPRLQPDLLGGADRDAIVARLLGLGARHLDVGQGDVPWVVLADREGNPFCVMHDRTEYVDTGPIAAPPLDSADPERDARFLAAISGWERWQHQGVRTPTLRHPSGHGPLLAICDEPEPKSGQNRLHLDVRPDSPAHRDELIAATLDLGGSRVEHDWGEFPWTAMADPSGNEFCILADAGNAGGS